MASTVDPCLPSFMRQAGERTVGDCAQTISTQD